MKKIQQTTNDNTKREKKLLLDDNPPPKVSSTQVFFKIGDMFKGIDKAAISFFYAENKLTYARVDNRNYPTTVQLKVLERELSGNFVRCHKKYLVNASHIDAILTKEGKIKIGKELIPIGYAYRKIFLESLHLLK